MNDVQSRSVEVEGDEAGPAGPAPRLRPSTMLAGAALVMLCLVVYLPGFFAIPPVDRDEARFAQASRQMYESVALPAAARDPAMHAGGLVIPYVQDRPRLNKPPLIYWAQAASAALFSGGNPYRDAIWMYRVPSILAAIAAVLFTWRLGASLFDSRTGALAAALLAVCPVIAWEARQARADMVLLAFTTLAAWALWKVREGAEAPGRARLKWPLIFWLALAGGVLTKGPITPLVCVLTALAYSWSARRWRWLLGLRLELGIPVLGLLIAPWVWGVARHVGLDRYLAIVSDEVLGRSVAGKEGHWGPPGYHLLLLPVLLWPGSLLTAAGLMLAWRAIRRRRMAGGTPALPMGPAPGEAPATVGEAYRFCLAWIVPAWLAFELISTKLPHYVLPLYPALAILSARAVLAASAGAISIRRILPIKLPWIAIGLAICVGLPLACWFLGARFSWRVIPFGLAWVLGLSLWIGQWRGPWSPGRGWTSRQLAGVLAAAATFLLLFGALLPGAKRLWISDRLLDVIEPLDPSFSRPLAAVGYHEDSLVFLRRGRVERISEADAGEWWRRNPGGFMIVPTSSVLRIHQPIGRAEGFNYSKGRTESLTVVQIIRPGAQGPPTQEGAR